MKSSPNEPIYLSSTEQPGKLSEILNCPKDVLIKAKDFLKCALSEESPCPIIPVSTLTSLLKGDECNFTIGNQLDDLAKLRNQLYFLRNISERYSYFFAERMFSNVPDKIKADLKIVPKELTTYSQIKEKLLAVRNTYENKFDFDLIKDMPVAELANAAAEKLYFDQAWLAVSNLDLSVANKMREPASSNANIGGEIRAQAFYKAY